MSGATSHKFCACTAGDMKDRMLDDDAHFLKKAFSVNVGSNDGRRGTRYQLLKPTRRRDITRPFFFHTLKPMSTKRGAFIVIEGVDRAGKSTQATLLKERFASQSSNCDVELIKFPGLLVQVYPTRPSHLMP
jgi:hypothetical protein